MRPRDEAQELLRSVIEMSDADERQARYGYERRLATRFGENAITQNAESTTESVTVEVAYGRREGAASTNRLDRASLREAVAHAQEIARAAPENPEHVPLPPPQAYPDVPPAFHGATAAADPDRLAADVAAVTESAKRLGYTASGLFQAVAAADAVANSMGLSAYHERTLAGYSATMHGPAGSGKAAASSNDMDRLDAVGLAHQLAENASAAQNPVDIEPGDYTVIFEPLAVSELLAFAMFTLSARDADEGTTVFSGQLGNRIVSESVTLGIRLDDPDLPAPPFGVAGLASRPTTWVENGRLVRLRHDRYWAAHKNTHADPLFAPLSMPGHDRSVDDLVADCEDGLLVKNLWYIRFVDRRELMLTGMTRDGLFRVRDGRIVGPVKNLRWNESPIVFLRNVLALSRAERAGERGWAKLPGIMSEGFTFTSTTESV